MSAGGPANLNKTMVNNARTPMAINRGQVSGVPAALKESLEQTWDAFSHAVSEAGLRLPRNPDLAASLLRVWACSDFAAGVVIRNWDWLVRNVATFCEPDGGFPYLPIVLRARQTFVNPCLAPGGFIPISILLLVLVYSFRIFLLTLESSLNF